MQPFGGRIAVLVSWLVVTATACGKQAEPPFQYEALTVTGIAEYVQRDGREQVMVVVQTAPLAEVAIESSVAPESWPGRHMTRSTPAGLAMFLVPPPPEGEIAGSIAVKVTLAEERKGGKARLLPPRRPSPVTLEAAEGGLACTGGPSCTLRLESDGTIELRAPKETRYTIGEHSGVVPRTGVVTIEQDPAQLLEQAPFALVCHAAGEAPPPPTTTAVKLELPDGPTLTADWPLTYGALVALATKQLEPVRERAVPPPEGAAGRAVLLIHGSSSRTRVHCVGAPQHFSDIRYVAFWEPQERTVSCGNYQRTTTMRVENYELLKRFTDRAISVYDRRTGQLDAEGVARAPNKPCPPQTEMHAEVSSSATDEDVVAWLERKYR